MIFRKKISYFHLSLAHFYYFEPNCTHMYLIMYKNKRTTYSAEFSKKEIEKITQRKKNAVKNIYYIIILLNYIRIIIKNFSKVFNCLIS